MTTAAAPDGAPWLEALSISKQFNGVYAVAEASVNVHAGEVRGVVGPNGAGKSTLMQIFAGSLVPDGGVLRIDGIEVRFRVPADAIAAGICLVQQEIQLAANYTVAQNVVLGDEPSRLGICSTSRSRRTALAALARLGLDVDPDTPVAELTGVQRRLVMVARALARDVRLIILDEPTAALAPHEADAVLSTVTGLANSGVAVFYVSHRFDDIERVAHTVTGVRDSRVIADLDRSQITRERLVALVSPTDETEPRRPVRIRDFEGEPREVAALEVSGLAGGPISDVSLSVAPGEVLGLAGLSGSGVDELMAMVSGHMPRTRGAVSALGRSLSSGDRVQAATAGVAYVPGDRSLAVFPNHDIKSNVSISSLRELSTAGFPIPKRENAQVAQTIATVGLKARIDQTISSLSGGNQQKAVFARWMSRQAAILLLHDPTAGVDVTARADIHERIREIASTGVAVLLVTTDLSELAALSDRVLVFDRGRIIESMDGTLLTEADVLDALAHGADTPPDDVN